jgi:sulfate-transporting ATPase
MGKEILKGINVGMYLGAKIGLLGPNGAGKSTLLKILAGVEKGFEGDMYLDPKIRVGYLAQVRLLVPEILQLLLLS